MLHRDKTVCFVPSSDSETSGGGDGVPTTAADAANCCLHAIDRLRKLLAARENESLEFKEARNNFDFGKLVKYCAALANEGGGSIVLGVGDKRPRRIVGSHAFADIERTKAGLLERLRFRVEIEVIIAAEGRVLIFDVPSRPLGIPIAVEGAYWMRAGEDLVAMTPDVLRRIFNETRPDFSAEVCGRATLDDLDPEAVSQFRIRWHATAHNAHLLQLSTEQLLGDAELATRDGVTYAALILLGTRAALTTHLAQSETIFEYRSSEAPGPANQREEFRRGFLTFYDRLWELVNLRNDKQHYQDRFVMHSIPTFREISVREAILNAAAHRDYQEAGSIFVRQYARRIEIVSPGGFAGGVSAGNILDRQFPRNRRIAESLLRCGLVERSGQGANQMLIEAVADSKAPPDYSRSDDYEVFLTMKGEVEDGDFVKLLKHLPAEQTAMLLSHHYLVLDRIRRNERVPRSLRKALAILKSFGVVGSEGRGRAVRYFFNNSTQSSSPSTESYTRAHARVDARQEALAHIRSSRREGRSIAEMLDFFPELSRGQVRALLRSLRAEGLVQVMGARKGSRWFPAEPSAELADFKAHKSP
jgi:ATP-dependent DNA helicase RecG